MFFKKRNINENLKKKIISFLKEADEEQDELSNLGEDQVADAIGHAEIKFAMRLLGDPNLTSSLRYLVDPLKGLENSKEMQNAKARGLEEIKKFRTGLYLIWLYGNKYFKSLWLKALYASDLYKQKYIIDPKLHKMEDEAKANYNQYVIPTLDEENIKNFKAFFKKFKNDLQQYISKDMKESDYNRLSNELKPWLKSPATLADDPEWLAKGFDPELSYEKTVFTEDFTELDFDYHIVNKFLESYLKINPKTGEASKDSNIDMLFVEEISKKLDLTNSFNQTKNMSAFEVKKFERILKDFSFEESEREKQKYQLTDDIQNKLDKIYFLDVKEDLLKKIGKLRDKVEKDLEKFEKITDPKAKKESINKRYKEYHDQVSKLIDDGLIESESSKSELSALEKFIATSTLEKVKSLPISARDSFYTLIKKEIKKSENASEKIVKDNKMSSEEKEEAIYQAIKDMNEDVEDKLNYFIEEFQKEQEDITTSMISKSQEQREKEYQELFKKSGFENRIAQDASRGQKVKFGQKGSLAVSESEYYNSINFKFDEQGNYRFKVKDLDGKDQSYENVQEYINQLKQEGNEQILIDKLKVSSRKVKLALDDLIRDLKNKKDEISILNTELSVASPSERNSIKSDMDSLKNEYSNNLKIYSQIESVIDVLDDEAGKIKVEDDSYEESELDLLKKKEVYEKLFKKIGNQLLNLPKLLPPQDLLMPVSPELKDISKIDEDDVLSQAMFIDIDNVKTNLDMLEESFKLYFFMKMIILSMERKQSENLEMSKIPADMDRLDKIQKRADIKKNKYNEYIKALNGFIKEVRDDIESYLVSMGSKYPEITKRLNTLLATITKYGSFANDKFHKDKFWTFRLIAGATGFWKPASFASIGENISNTLLQAMWIENLIKTNKLAQLRTFTFQKWLDIFEMKYKISGGFDFKNIENLQNQVVGMKEKLKNKAATPVKNKKEEQDKKLAELLSSNAKYQKVLKELEQLARDKKKQKEDLEFAEMSDNYDDIDAIQNEIEAIDEEIKDNLKEKAKIERDERKKITLSSAEGTEEIDKSILGQIQSIESEIEKGPKFVQDEKNPIRLGNIANKDFSPEHIFNQLRIGKVVNNKLELSPNTKEIIKDFLDETQGENEAEGTPKEKFDIRTQGKKLGDLSPDYISKLLNDNNSPYKQFHSQLMYDYFSKKRGSDNQRNVRQAIITWMRANYSDQWLPTGMRSSRSADGLKAGSNPADDIIWNMIVDYAFGISRRKLDITNMKVIQEPQEMLNDLMNKFNSMDWANVMTVADPSKNSDISEDKNARAKFFMKLIKAATFKSEKGILKPLGPIAEAVFQDLLNPNFVAMFESWVNGLGDRKLMEYFESGIKDVEFYEEFGDTVVDPAIYRSQTGK